MKNNTHVASEQPFVAGACSISGHFISCLRFTSFHLSPQVLRFSRGLNFRALSHFISQRDYSLERFERHKQITVGLDVFPISTVQTTPLMAEWLG
jgi:hypothetical protein